MHLLCSPTAAVALGTALAVDMSPRYSTPPVWARCYSTCSLPRKNGSGATCSISACSPAVCSTSPANCAPCPASHAFSATSALAPAPQPPFTPPRFQERRSRPSSLAVGGPTLPAPGLRRSVPLPCSSSAASTTL